MVTDHTETSNDLEGLVTGGKVKAELPTAVDSSHQSKLDKLKDASGKDFSSDFDSYQVSAHKDAVSLFERYAKGGDSADLKDWAGKTLPPCGTISRWLRSLARRRASASPASHTPTGTATWCRRSASIFLPGATMHLRPR
jgi:predicted outer membrane protein